MVMVCEPVALAVTSHGIAFEVDIKKPTGAEVMTPVRTRLESQSAMPRLLGSGRKSASELPESPQKLVAEKARAQNEKRAAVVARVQSNRDQCIDKLRCNLEFLLEKAAQNRQASLTDKSSKAGKHFKDVRAKVGDVRQQHSDANAEHHRRLEEAMLQKAEVQSLGVAERRAKANLHNSSVAKRVQQHIETLEQRKAELRLKQQAVQERADALRAQLKRKAPKCLSVGNGENGCE